jgi:hypothetical protein
MPGYIFHIIFGIVFAGIISYGVYKMNILPLPGWYLFVAIPVLFLYCIFPDIDTSASIMRLIVNSIGLGAIIVLLVLDIKIIAILIAVVLFVLQFTEHRKFFHSITAAVIFSAPLIFIHYTLAIFAFIGYFSHLLIDGKLTII